MFLSKKNQELQALKIPISFYPISAYVIFVSIFAFPSTISVGALYMIMAFIAIIEPMFTFILIGASNYLPIYLGISPLVLAIIMMVISICFNNPKIRIIRTDKYMVGLVFMVAWTALTGFLHNDFSFFSNLVTFFIFYFSFQLFIANIKTDIRDVLSFLIMGFGFGIVLNLFIQAGINGFYSNHPFRLAMGERADPNSTALIFAIFCTYAFIKASECLKENMIRSIFYSFLFVAGGWTLLLTQSRGSILCLIITISTYIFSIQKKMVSRKGLIRFFALLLFACLCVVLFKNYIIVLVEAYQQFSLRISSSDSTDGARIDLFQKSIKSFFNNPVFGVSLTNFAAKAGHVPHNTFSDYMVTNGIIGIAFYVFLYLNPLFEYYKFCRNNSNLLIYFCYFVCGLNIFFYSASNEKISLLLILILVSSVNSKIAMMSSKPFIR